MSAKNIRGILFGLGSFLAVSCLAAYFISQRTQLSIDEEVELKGWPITLRVPAEWDEGQQVTDLGGAEVHVFRPVPDRNRPNIAILRVRRVAAANATKPEDYCNDVIAQYAAIAGLTSLKEVRFAQAQMGDWPASLATVNRRRDPLRNRLGLHVQVLAAVDRQQAPPFGYSIDLQTTGPITNREQAIWDRIIKSIRTVPVSP